MYWLIGFAMRAMMPRTEALPGIADTELDAFLRQLHRESEPMYWTGLVVGAVVFALTPLFTVGVPLPAFLLPAGLLERHADRLVGSRNYTLRQAAFLVRLSAGMCWGRDPAVRAKFALAPYPVDPGPFRRS
jgi:hypothetical protein